MVQLVKLLKDYRVAHQNKRSGNAPLESINNRIGSHQCNESLNDLNPLQSII